MSNGRFHASRTPWRRESVHPHGAAVVHGRARARAAAPPGRACRVPGLVHQGQETAPGLSRRCRGPRRRSRGGSRAGAGRTRRTPSGSAGRSGPRSAPSMPNTWTPIDPVFSGVNERSFSAVAGVPERPRRGQQRWRALVGAPGQVAARRQPRQRTVGLEAPPLLGVVVEVLAEQPVRVAEPLREVGAGGVEQQLRRLQRAAGHDDRRRRSMRAPHARWPGRGTSTAVDRPLRARPLEPERVRARAQLEVRRARAAAARSSVKLLKAVPRRATNQSGPSARGRAVRPWPCVRGDPADGLPVRRAASARGGSCPAGSAGTSPGDAVTWRTCSASS